MPLHLTIPQDSVGGPGQRELTIRTDSGPVVAGAIGERKFQYDLWGDAVNTASRMESHGEPGRIHLSPATRDLVKDRIRCSPRGPMSVKGKGMMETWFVD